MKHSFFALLILVLFAGCSSKQYFEPEVLGDDWDRYESSSFEIVDVTSNAALLDDGTVLSKTEQIDVLVPEGHRVVTVTEEWVVSASIDGKTTLTARANKKIQEHFDFKKSVATASVQGDLLAVVFADNELALYDIATKQILFQEQGGRAIALDSRIFPPFFMQSLVVFATLDGKVVIVNSELKKRLRTVIVSSESAFNNVIHAALLDNKIIAATPYKLLSMSQKDFRAAYEIRNVVYSKERIYITTKQGELFALTPELQVEKKEKFAFAHFLGMIELGEKLYILEKEGFLIVVDKNSFAYTVHEVDLDEGYVFVGEKAFYVHDEKIILE